MENGRLANLQLISLVKDATVDLWDWLPGLFILQLSIWLIRKLIEV